jgi:hypothetical protein
VKRIAFTPSLIFRNSIEPGTNDEHTSTRREEVVPEFAG